MKLTTRRLARSLKQRCLLLQLIATDADPDVRFSGRRMKHGPSRQGHRDQRAGFALSLSVKFTKPSPNRRLQQCTGFESIAERKLRRSRLTEDGNVDAIQAKLLEA